MFYPGKCWYLILRESEEFYSADYNKFTLPFHYFLIYNDRLRSNFVGMSNVKPKKKDRHFLILISGVLISMIHFMISFIHIRLNVLGTQTFHFANTL